MKKKQIRDGVKARLDALHPSCFHDEMTWKHDVKGTLSMIQEYADIHELTEKERIEGVIEEHKINIHAIPNDIIQRDESEGYNQALDDIIKAIKQ